MKAKDLVRHELIGLYAEVVGASNKSNVGISGKILDETKYTLLIDAKQGRKRVLKENITINLHVGDQLFKIDGKSISGRPKERIKR